MATPESSMGFSSLSEPLWRSRSARPFKWWCFVVMRMAFIVILSGCEGSWEVRWVLLRLAREVGGGRPQRGAFGLGMVPIFVLFTGGYWVSEILGWTEGWHEACSSRVRCTLAEVVRWFYYLKPGTGESFKLFSPPKFTRLFLRCLGSQSFSPALLGLLFPGSAETAEYSFDILFYPAAFLEPS